jgi:hypothetical protein
VPAELVRAVHFREKWTYVKVGANLFFSRKERKGKGKGKERALVYWLTLLYLFASRLYVVTATLSGKLVKVTISNEEYP